MRPRVDAVELNPQVIALVDSTFGGFSGRIYSRPPVHFHVQEARSFVARAGRQYDLIELPAQGSFGAAASGAHGLGESYVDTVEAFQGYLRRLRPGGLLTATRWVQVPPRDPLKLFATAVVALEQEGVADPGTRLAMIRGWQTATLVVKNGELSAADLAAVRDFAEARSFDLVHLPGMRAEEADRFNQLGEAYFYTGTQALLGPERDAFIARYKFDLRPATDDRPYFGDFFRWRALPEILALRSQGGAGLLEWGYLVLAATLAQAALLSAILILLPLAGRRLREAGSGRGRTAVYFLAIGLAFLFIEIAFIQRFTLFLGNPIYAVAVVLAGFLVFAGVGSACAPAFARYPGGHLGPHAPPTDPRCSFCRGPRCHFLSGSAATRARPADAAARRGQGAGGALADSTAGSADGHAVPARPGADAAGARALGLGHQRLGFGAQRRAGDDPGPPARLPDGRGHGIPAVRWSRLSPARPAGSFPSSRRQAERSPASRLFEPADCASGQGQGSLMRIPTEDPASAAFRPISSGVGLRSPVRYASPAAQRAGDVLARVPPVVSGR